MDPDRHLLLVTAHPASKDTAFRDLIGLTNPALRTADLGSEAGRLLLAHHMVQRRRADIRSDLVETATFPADRQTPEVPTPQSTAPEAVFGDVLAHVRGRVQDRAGTKLQHRVRWWSALSLRRSMASSPAAAAATLSTRAALADALGAGRSWIRSGTTSRTPQTPLRARSRTSTTGDAAAGTGAQALAADPAADAKLALLTTQVKRLLDDRFHLIVFAWFHPQGVGAGQGGVPVPHRQRDVGGLQGSGPNRTLTKGCWTEARGDPYGCRR